MNKEIVLYEDERFKETATIKDSYVLLTKDCNYEHIPKKDYLIPIDYLRKIMAHIDETEAFIEASEWNQEEVDKKAKELGKIGVGIPTMKWRGK